MDDKPIIKIDNYISLFESQLQMIKAFDIKSNEGSIYAFLGWNRCGSDIEKYQNCKKTGTPYDKDPTECYNQAKTLQLCYSQQAMKVDPLCLPIFNDAKECLFQGDSHLWNCKEEVNEFLYCQQKPSEYVEFLKMSTPQQRLPKRYNYVQNEARYDWN